MEANTQYIHILPNPGTQTTVVSASAVYTYSKALHLFLPITHLTWEHTLPLKVTEKIQIDGDMTVQQSVLKPII